MSSQTVRITMILAITLGLVASGTAPNAAEDERKLFALNLYHEGRSEGRSGMVAIGWVVLNRVEDGYYPNRIAEVITQRNGSHCAFGWWCDGRSDTPTEPDAWNIAQQLSDLMLGDLPPSDPTGGALWFHHTSLDRPAWMGDDVIRTATFGKHHFYGRR